MSKLLISHGSQVCAKTAHGSTVLDRAAMGRGDARMATLLIEAGAKVATTDVNGVSALHLAAYYATPEVLEVLINAGYDVNLKTLEGTAPLYEASHSGNVDSMEFLLAKGADLNAKLSNGCTILHAAADSRRAAADAVRLLVNMGANTEARDSYGRSPLDMAISAENDDVVELLSGNILLSV
ncbi:hypothetical protein ACLOAV_008606 [Pseudogymnoascus australis]